MHATGKCPFDRAETLHTEFLRELRIEQQLGSTSVNEEDHFRPTINTHVNERKRVELEEFQACDIAFAMNFIWSLSLECS